MPTRFLCANCGSAQRKPGACRQCGVSTTPVLLDHSGAGIAMYVAAALGGVMILVAFFGLGILILVSFIPLGAALALNVVDDRALDGTARIQALELAKQVVRHPPCRTAYRFDPQRQRWFCPRCGTYV